MKIIDDQRFIKGVERLTNPMDVGALHFFQTFNRLLPKPLLRFLLNNASKKTPYMGFVIEPYSLFCFFKLKDIEKAKSYLPERYELIKTKVFADDEPDYYFAIGNLNTHASAFWGIRQESYVVAKDKQTGLLTWVFIDILSNTIIAIPAKGIDDPNANKAVFTTNAKGEIFLDIKEDKTNRQIILNGNLLNGKMRNLDQRLWLEGNLSICYGRNLAGNDDKPFALIYDPAEVKEAMDVPIKDIRVVKNTLFPGLAEVDPVKVVCFPFAQHYISDSPSRHTLIKNRLGLISNYNKLGALKGIKSFTSKTIKKQFFAGVLISNLISTALLIYFIFHFIYSH